MLELIIPNPTLPDGVKKKAYLRTEAETWLQIVEYSAWKQGDGQLVSTSGVLSAGWAAAIEELQDQPELPHDEKEPFVSGFEEGWTARRNQTRWQHCRRRAWQKIE